MLKSVKLTRRLTIFIVLVCALAIFTSWILLRPNSYSVIVLNRSGADLMITDVRVNDESIGTGARVLKPIGPSAKRSNSDTFLDYSFKAPPSSVLSVDVSYQIGKSDRLTCELVDQNKAGCIFYVNVRNSGNLTCICDSNADFYN